MLGRHQVHTIVQDLIYLRKWMTDPPDDEIRRGSAILRRLLVERELGNAWRSLGYEKEPRIAAMDLKAAVTGRAEASLVFALAGGGTYKKWKCACMALWKNEKPPDGEVAPVERPFGLSEYIESPSAFVEGQTISRRNVIQYMANVRGGVHLGTQKARRQENMFICRMAKLEGAVNAFMLNGLLYELLSIGQAVSQAPDSSLLIEAYNHGGSV